VRACDHGGMRVIAGTRGGRRLTGPDTPDTRPVTDRVKESVFSSLGSFVVGADVADLFAGAGSFGIESLSRGAESAVFVENGRKALESLRRNLADLGLEGTVVQADVAEWVVAPRGPFDLVFCDPPWPLTTPSLAAILEDLTPSLAEDALVIVTRRATDDVPYPTGYAIDDERRHGDTRIIRYMLKDNP
jgi:16S rRNA (guanine966-N2)-methyltransferase